MNAPAMDALMEQEIALTLPEFDEDTASAIGAAMRARG